MTRRGSFFLRVRMLKLVTPTFPLGFQMSSSIYSQVEVNLLSPGKDGMRIALG
jgi:hypothetical protein